MTDNTPTTRAEAREEREELAQRTKLALTILTIGFWNYGLERAVWTFAQTFAAVAGVGGISLGEIPWLLALSSSAGAAILSLSKSYVLYASAERRVTSEPPAEQTGTGPSEGEGL